MFLVTDTIVAGEEITVSYLKEGYYREKGDCLCSTCTGVEPTWLRNPEPRPIAVNALTRSGSDVKEKKKVRRGIKRKRRTQEEDGEVDAPSVRKKQKI